MLAVSCARGAGMPAMCTTHVLFLVMAASAAPRVVPESGADMFSFSMQAAAEPSVNIVHSSCCTNCCWKTVCVFGAQAID